MEKETVSMLMSKVLKKEMRRLARRHHRSLSAEISTACEQWVMREQGVDTLKEGTGDEGL